MFYSKKSSGFTLVELLIVIAILGFLMAVVLVLINPRQVLDRSRTTAGASVAGKLCNAVQACRIASTTGVCGETGSGTTLPATPTNLPGGVTVNTKTDTAIQVTAQMSGATECVIDCNPSDGEVKLGAGCVK